MNEADPLDLDQLPDFDPPAELWSRILSARLGQERRRHRIQGSIMAAATVALAVALVAVMGREVPLVDGGMVSLPVGDNNVLTGQKTIQPGALLNDLIEESRLLETRLRVLPQNTLTAWQQEEIRLNRMRVALIDKQIARAYQDGMSSSAIELLWRARTKNMRQILETYDQARLATRI